MSVLTSELRNKISWNADANKLDSFKALSKDLTFRRILTQTFPTHDKPFPRYRIRSFVRCRQFEELLIQAIDIANRDFPGWYSTNLITQVSPESIANQQSLGGSRLTNKEMWFARLLVFEKLVTIPDFRQLVLESENIWWVRLLTFLRCGESSPKARSGPSMPPAPPTAVTGASTMRSLADPILRSFVYLVPITLGAGLVGTQIIEKQAQVQLLQPINNTQNDPRLGKIAEQVNEITNQFPTLNQIAADTKAINHQVPAIEGISKETMGIAQKTSTLLDGTAAIALKTNDISEEVGDGTDSTTLRGQTNKIGTEVSVLASGGNKSPSPIDPTFVANLSNFLKNVADHDGLVVRLGNAEPDPKQKGSPGSSSLQLNLEAGNLNLHQGAYPVEYTSEISKDASIPPFLRAFEPPQNTLTLKNKDITGGTGDTVLAVMRLCNEAPPYIIIIATGGANNVKATDCQAPAPTQDQNGAQPTPQSSGTTRALTVTKTPQFVDEISAYLSLDASSRRSYWLFGQRRVVLQITPARKN